MSRYLPPRIEREEVIGLLDSYYTFRLLSPYIIILTLIVAASFASRHCFVYIDKGLRLIEKMILFFIAFFIVIIIGEMAWSTIHGLFFSTNLPISLHESDSLSWLEMLVWMDTKARDLLSWSGK